MAIKKNLVEFKSDDGQSETADPVAKDSGRPADKHNDQPPAQFATKVEALNAVMQKLSGLPKEHIANVFKGMTDETNLGPEKAKATRRLGGTAKDDGPPGKGETISSAEISGTSDKPFKYKGEAKEEIDHIFGADTLTEDARERALVIFESAVNLRLATEVARLEEEFDAHLEEALEEKIASLAENVDKYLSYAVEAWAEDNALAIETGLKAEVTEDFIRGMKALFVENYVDIPEDKVDLVAELSASVKALEEKFNGLVKENLELKDYVDTLEVEKVFNETVESLPLTQQEKLRSLVEGVEYADVEEFTKKLNIIKSTYFTEDGKPKKVSLVEQTEIVNNEEEENAAPAVTGPMAAYMQAISSTAKK